MRQAGQRLQTTHDAITALHDKAASSADTAAQNARLARGYDGSGYSESYATRKLPSATQIFHAIINSEGSGWPGCLEYIPGEYICSTHQIQELYIDLKYGKRSMLTLRTIGHGPNNRPGYTQLVEVEI